jgi:acetoin utilization protein AcuC
VARQPDDNRPGQPGPFDPTDPARVGITPVNATPERSSTMDTRSELSTATTNPTLSPVTDPMTVAWAPKRTADGALTVVHSDDYAGWVFDASHPTQGRRFMNARDLVLAHAAESGVRVTQLESDLLPAFSTMQLAHTAEYVESVVLGGESGEWSGSRPDLGRLALQMAGGTILALDSLLSGETMTAVHFAGAKHHAMRDRSSGFCVFADFAIAAKLAMSRTRVMQTPRGTFRVPMRVAILDIDAHHGDGTERLTSGDDRILTMSVHDRSIFPGTGRGDDPASHVYNTPLEPGSGDEQLADAAAFFVGLCERFNPDLIMIAAGADGLDGDPLSTLTYTIEGLEYAVRYVRRGFRDLPMLIGGAGGYRPDDLTPRAWARMAVAAALPVGDHERTWCDLDDCDYELDPEDLEERRT